MKPLPAKATAKDYQKAVEAYARKTGQTYTVDSAAFDPVTPVKPRQTMAPAEIPSDVPTSFTYLSVPDCRKKREGKFDPSTGSPGKIVNHYQWCGWADAVITVYEPHPLYPNIKIPAGQVQMRITFIGWGSNKSSKHTTDIYVDEIQPIGGQAGLTLDNTTITFRSFCESIYGGGGCDLTTPAPRATLAALKAGAVLHISNSVTLPALDPANNPDRVTGFNAAIVVELTTTVYPGLVLTGGVVKPLIRCDGATEAGRGGFLYPACIFAGVLPSYQLRTSDGPIKEVAEHIYQAINSPGTTDPSEDHTKLIPSLLHRHVDQARRDDNRAVATGVCNVLWGTPRPDGKHCDEYPFATSREGAANRENYGTTWDFSVKLVSPTSNTTEGGRRSGWYNNDRILDADEFAVVVTP